MISQKKESNAVFDSGLATIEARSNRKLNAVRLSSVGKLLISIGNGAEWSASGITEKKNGRTKRNLARRPR